MLLKVGDRVWTILGAEGPEDELWDYPVPGTPGEVIEAKPDMCGLVIRFLRPVRFNSGDVMEPVGDDLYCRRLMYPSELRQIPEEAP